MTAANDLGGVLRIVISDAPPSDPELKSRIDAAWHLLKTTSPRLFDGPILLVEPGLGPVRKAPLTACRDTYRTLATAHVIGRAVRALGVQGIVRGEDAHGRAHTLFGRRSSETRIYGGLWESAPSGSLNASPDCTELTLADCEAALREESIEELGIDLDDAVFKWQAVLEDPLAMSTDIVLEIWPPHPIDPQRSLCSADRCARWEYVDAAWVEDHELQGWFDRHTAAISPPTSAMLCWLGLIDPT